MKPIFINADNAYHICRHCAAVNKCKGTEAFYGCSTWRWKKREVIKRVKVHADIYLTHDGRNILFERASY